MKIIKTTLGILLYIAVMVAGAFMITRFMGPLHILSNILCMVYLVTVTVVKTKVFGEWCEC